MSFSSAVTLFLGVSIIIAGFVLGIVVYPMENGRPSWPIMGGGAVIGGLITGFGLLTLLSRRQT